MAYTHELVKLESQYKENPRRYAAPFADALRKNEEFDRAIEVIRHGLELNPEYIPASVVLGRTQLDLGNDAEAQVAFDRVLQLDRENVIALKALADIAERQYRFDVAEERLNYLLEVDRNNREALDQLARVQEARAAGITAPPPPPEPEAPEMDATDPAYEALADEAEPAPEPAEEDEQPDEDEVAEPTPTPRDWNTWTGMGGGPAAARPADEEDAGDIVDRTDLVDSPNPDEDLGEPWDPWAVAEEPAEAIELSDTGGSGDAEDLGVVRSEEIVLRPSSASEFQAPSDAETLLARGGDEVDAPAASGGNAFDLTGSEDDIVEEPSAIRWGDVGRSAEPSEEEVEADDLDEDSGWDDEPETAAEATTADAAPEALEPAPAPKEESTGPVFPSWSRETSLASEPEPDTTESESDDASLAFPAWPDPSEADSPPAPAADEPEPVMTETMAELYLRQGHTDEALRVYQALQARHPEDARYAERVRSLAPEAELVAPPSPHAAQTTGGQSLGSFLGALLSARPAAVDLPPTPPRAGISRPSPIAGTPSEPTADQTEDDDPSAPAPGTPTRPASDRLSLSAVFGDESSPVPPAIAGPGDPAGQREGPEGFSFDEFFSGATSPGGPRKSSSVRLSRGGSGSGTGSDEDLDQFNAWLQSLKG